AEIYQSFAKRWPDPPIGTLWQQMATEEISHATLLEHAARLPGAERDDPGLDTAKLVALRETVCTRFLASEASLDEAFAAALDLEQLELDNVYRRLLALSSDDSRMSATFRAALGQVDRHENTLLSAMETQASDPKLLERAAQVRRRMLQYSAAQS